MVLKNRPHCGGKGFEKPQVTGWKGFEKLGRRTSLRFENRHLQSHTIRARSDLYAAAYRPLPSADTAGRLASRSPSAHDFRDADQRSGETRCQ